MYDFTKLRNKEKIKEYKHLFFRKDKKHLLEYIKRKAPDQIEDTHDKQKESLQVVDEWQKVAKHVNTTLENDNCQKISNTIDCEKDSLFSKEAVKTDANNQTTELITCFMLYTKSQKIEDNTICQEKKGMIQKHTEEYIKAIQTLQERKIAIAVPSIKVNFFLRLSFLKFKKDIFK